MSAARFIAAATVVIVALLCTPAALVPVVNSADAIVCLAPIVLVLVVLWPRSRGAASAWIADIDETHPEALSRLDRLDGVGTRLPSSLTPAGGDSPTDAPHVMPPAGSLLHQ